jgi:hypothetical protein
MTTTVDDGPAVVAPRVRVSVAPPRRMPSLVPSVQKPRPRKRVLPQPVVDDQSATLLEEGSLVKARRLCATEQYRDALALLELALPDHPESIACRKLLLKACIGLRRADDAALHGEWLIARFVRAGQDATVCDVSARIVRARLQAPWRETTLTTVALAAKRAKKSTVLLDATKRLLKLFPASRALPSILLAAADRQAAKGRKDLAHKTLRHIIARYPNHVEAMRAEQRLTRASEPRALG